MAQTVACSVGLDDGYVRHRHPEQADSWYRSCGGPDFEVVAGSTGAPIEVVMDEDFVLRGWQLDDGPGGITGITSAGHIQGLV